MQSNLRVVAAIALVTVGLFGEAAYDKAAKLIVGEGPDAFNNEDYDGLVNSIVEIDIEEDDAEMISDFFSELASVVKEDTQFLKNTGQFREFNMIAGGLNFAGEGVKDKYPTLGEEIDNAILSAIGNKNVTMDEDKREDLVFVLEAISWGVKQ